MAEKSSKWEIYCSFCNEHKRNVKYLVAGPGVSICDACLIIAIEALEEAGSPLDLKRISPKLEIEEFGLKPRFKKINFDLKKNHCFYLCPFSEPFNTIYKDHVTKAIDEEGLTIERADEIFGTDPIIEDIWEGICTCAFVIADVTGRNPNVMYEIGMAHTVGKPVIIITQNMDDVPFDLKHYRCIVYEYTPRGCNNLEKSLRGTFKFLRGRQKIK